jgi:hypothetical protein
MERVLLKEDNYLEWTDYIRNELLARGPWNIVLGIKEKPRKPAAPKSVSTTTAAAGGGRGKAKEDEDDPKPGSAAAILAKVQLEAEMVSETTPESDEAVYMSDFRRYLIQRDTYLDDVKTGEGREGSRRSGWPGNWHKWVSQFAEAEKIGSASAAGQNSANGSGGLRVCLIGVHAFVRQTPSPCMHLPVAFLSKFVDQ